MTYCNLKLVLKYARKNRRNPTRTELLLRRVLDAQPRDSAFHPYTFQLAIGKYIPDFFFERAKLVVELDGPSHETTKEADACRTKDLEGRGCTVIRFQNKRVFNDLPAVLREIQAAIVECVKKKTPWRYVNVKTPIVKPVVDLERVLASMHQQAQNVSVCPVPQTKEQREKRARLESKKAKRIETRRAKARRRRDRKRAKGNW